MEDYTRAVEIFKEVIELDPDLSFAYSSLAAAYIQLGDDKEAKIAARELLKIRPNFSVKSFVNVAPFKNQDRSDRFRKSLLKAGLPE